MSIHLCIAVGNSATFNQINLPHCCVCPKPRLAFPMSYVMVFFMFNDLMYEVVVRFDDNDAFVDNHCLNFLFSIDTISVIQTNYLG